MNEDINESVRNIMSFTVTIAMIGLGVFFLMYAQDQGYKLINLSFNKVVGTVCILYGILRAFLLYKSLKK